MSGKINEKTFKQIVLDDYSLAYRSRQISLLGRREVLSGKAKFGIFGDGKELPQIALSKFFESGDFRTGYYRDQTLMMAIENLTIEQFFSQLYAHANQKYEPFSSGRSMTGHFSTHLLNPDGSWKPLKALKNSSADISPTAGQMSRLVGLAQASKIYKLHPELKNNSFSEKGKEVVFATIGDASTSEGGFFEAINAIGVLQIPAIISVWDDNYGISVEKKYQTTKASISEVLKGFEADENNKGFAIYKVKGWNYPELIKTYAQATENTRKTHQPALIHITELTQPQGHSTSGSHERYKSKERLEWEKEYCCIKQFKKWILNKKICSESKIKEIEQQETEVVKEAKNTAWKNICNEIFKEKKQAINLAQNIISIFPDENLEKEITLLEQNKEPLRKDFLNLVKKTLRKTRGKEHKTIDALKKFISNSKSETEEKYNSFLYTNFKTSPLKLKTIDPILSNKSVDGRIIIRDNFDKLLKNYPEVLIFGEDSGKIGGVNQGLEELQDKYGELRVFDTGIRENTIIGQGIGMAMRGLRPIAEIQYLDYLLYGIQILSDDLSTLSYRTKGTQKAPLIVRTRGHRLEGIWHAGSPMGMIINALKGMHICVPRNMTQAAGFYNLLIKSDEPALVIEPLNGYRVKETAIENYGEFTTPLGIPEVVVEGKDLTLVTYGSTCNIVISTLLELNQLNIYPEIIDVRTLMPFDITHIISKSLKKTNKLLIIDEDVKGGASAFILQQILEKQNGYYLLDEQPKTLTAKNHRPAYGSDGDYFSKPNKDDIIDIIYSMMNKSNIQNFPNYY